MLDDRAGPARLHHVRRRGGRTAIRLARTVSGRDRIAYFTDDIHGRSDIVLGRAVDVRGELRTLPMVAGVPQRAVDDAFVLEYGSDELWT